MKLNSVFNLGSACPLFKQIAEWESYLYGQISAHNNKYVWMV